MVINLRKEECSTVIVAQPRLVLGSLLWNQLPVQVWEDDTLSAFKARLKPSSLRKLMVTNSSRPSSCCISTILPPLPSQATAGVAPYKPGPAQGQVRREICFAGWALAP